MKRYASVRALSVLALAALAACSEGSGPPTEVIDPPPTVNPERPNHVPPPALFDSVYVEATITCNATRSPASITCETPQAPFAGPWNVGGKGTHVRTLTSATSYVSGVFQTSVRFRNLLVNRMGTADGVEETGIMAFIMANPQTITGTGTVTVANPDSIGTFTAANQRYFFYDTVLAMNDTSMARQWKFNVPATVNTFRFKVYLAAPVLPILVYDKDVAGNRDIYRVNLDGTDLVRLTNTAGTDRDPTVANGRVVWVSYRNQNAELYSMLLQGGTQSRLTTSSTVSETAPALSLDGTRLAFASDDGGVSKIWIGTFGGTTLANAAPVTSSPGNVIEFGPAWNRSGMVRYVSTSGATADMFEYTLGGGAPVLFAVSSATAADVEPAVSHDGLRTLWATTRDAGDTEIYWRQGTTTFRQTNRLGVDAQPTFLSDGKMVWVEEGSPTVLRWKSSTTAATGTLPYGNDASARNPYGVPLHQ
jgi:hypothetical protein